MNMYALCLCKVALECFYYGKTATLFFSGSVVFTIQAQGCGQPGFPLFSFTLGQNGSIGAVWRHLCYSGAVVLF